MALVGFVVAILLDRWLKAIATRRRGASVALSFGLVLEYTRHVIPARRRRWLRLVALAPCAIALLAIAPSSATTAYAIAISGAASNGFDDATAGYVVNSFTFLDRVAFNVADVALVAGLVAGSIEIVL